MVGYRELSEPERAWAARFEVLKDAGYVLRARYRPGWVADWKDDPTSFAMPSETAIQHTKVTTLDARRTSDNTFVFLKVAPKDAPEVEINRYLSSPELRKDVRNPAASLLDVVELPDEPDAVDYSDDNMMMDGRRLFPHGWHSRNGEMAVDAELMNSELYPSRTLVGGVRYYYVDFGLSSRGTSKVLGLDGQIRAPELSDEVPYDPFKLDVYDLGAAYDYYVYKHRSGRRVEFIASLIKYMTPLKPENRPTIAEALEYFRKIRADLTPDALTHRYYRARYRSGFNRIWCDVTYRLKELWLRYHPMPPLPPLQ